VSARIALPAAHRQSQPIIAGLFKQGAAQRTVANTNIEHYREGNDQAARRLELTAERGRRLSPLLCHGPLRPSEAMQSQHPS